MKHFFILAMAALISPAAGAAPAQGEAAQDVADPLPELRAMAEIDDDPATLTPREAQKLALLAQVLGADPALAARYVVTHSVMPTGLDQTPRSDS
ncbi:hypothetical protein [Profundibacterium mesophilum]|uniref:Uncharacterized protein n=1 Tax=Profundibacterium mesophilum KAUST100406-0324 TaxID=1037889 RepID=A0A921NR99_9RHOB|nr:hypothetical protein [Profundibacterium mesophilum]KAF0677122.1 hypothetical protein PMES_00437 [Profundibacterium mesophilum KAUST100406-0324]